MKNLLLIFLSFTTIFALEAQPCNDPPPVMFGDLCDVDPICGFEALNGYCLDMFPQTYQGNPGIVGCGGSATWQNSSWFAFVAGGGQLTLTIDAFDCSGGSGNSGIQAGIYGGSCSSLQAVSVQCNCTVGTVTLSANLTAGQTYYVFIDGCGGSVCQDVTITVTGNADPPMASPPTGIENVQIPEFESPDTICIDAVGVDFSIPGGVPMGAFGILWTIDGGPYIASPGSASITLDFPQAQYPAGSTVEVCAYAYNDCDTNLMTPQCKDVIISPITTVYEEEEVCEGDPNYIWSHPSQPQNVNTNSSNLDPGTYTFTATRVNSFSCDYMAELTLTVHPDNEYDTTIVACGDEIPYSFNGQTFIQTGMQDVNLSTTRGCDSTIHVDFYVLDYQAIEGEITCAPGGMIEVELIEQTLEVPDGATITYSWFLPSTGQIIEEKTLNYPDPSFDPNLYFPYDQYMTSTNISLNVSIEFNGKVCAFMGAASYTYNPLNHIPGEFEIIGPDTVCIPHSSEEYEAILLTGQDPIPLGYTWDENPAVIVSNPLGNPVNISFNGVPLTNGIGMVTLSVTAENLCGASFGPPATKDVIVVEAIPVNAGADDVACGDTYQLDAMAGSSGMWAQTGGPGSATFDDATDPNTEVTVSMPGVYTFEWAEGIGSCTSSDDVEIEFNPGLSITNQSLMCDGTNTNFIITFEIMGGQAPYTVASGNGSISGNVFTSDPIPSGMSVNVTIESNDGCVETFGPFTRLCNCETNAGGMSSALLDTCGDGCVEAMGDPMNMPQFDANDVLEYFLHSGSGSALGMVLDQNTTGEFCRPAGAMDGVTYYISAVVGDDDGSGSVDLNDNCLSVAAGQPVVWYDYPVAEAGPADAVCGLNYTMQAVLSTGTGAWDQLSGPGTATFTTPTSPTSMVSVDQYGDYTFRWIEDNGGCRDTATVDIEFLNVPMQLGYEIICSPDNMSYTAVVIMESGYGPFTVVSGDIASVSGDTIFTTSIMNNNSFSGELTTVDGCTFTIDGSGSCNCFTDAGTMPSDRIDTCISFAIGSESNLDTVMEPGDIGYYVLHTQGGTILGTILATSTDGVFSFDGATMTAGVTYYISFVVGPDDGSGVIDYNDVCFSVAAGTPVRWFEPPVVDAGADMVTCGLSVSLNGSANYASVWTTISTPGGSMATITDPSMAVTSVDVDGSGDYCFELRSTAYGCTTADTVCVTFPPNPTWDDGTLQFDCDGAGENYTVTVNVNEPDPGNIEFSGDGGSYSGGVFTSDPIPSDSPYFFLVTNTQLCSYDTLSGVYGCACVTAVGSMDLAQIDVCLGEDVSASYDAAGEFIDANDILVFILHEGSGTAIVNPLAENTTAEFSYMGGVIMPGVTYYISPVVGNDIGGTVDLSDDCTVVGAGTPVVWHGPPTADVTSSGDTITCASPSVMLSGSGSSGPNTFTYTWSSADGNVPPAQMNDEEITISTKGTYVLVIEDQVSGCRDTASYYIEQSDDIPEVSIQPAQEVLTCDVSSVQFDGTGSSQGIYYWIGDQGQDIEDSLTLMPTMTQTGVYTLVIEDQVSGCSNSGQVEVVIDTVAPQAAAFSPDEFNCSVSEVTLDGSGSSTGPQYSYSWSPAATIVSGINTLTPMVNAAGIYTLTVTDTNNGCTSTATTEATRDSTVIQSAEAEVDNPECNGETVGSIVISNVMGGTPPFTYILNGTVTQDDGSFTDLGAGSYTIEIVDANGCSFMLPQAFEIVLPVEISVDLGEDQVVLFGEDITLDPEVTPVEDGIMYTWTSAGDSSVICPDCAEQNVMPSVQTTYSVVVRDSFGCVATDEVTLFVRIPRDVYIPNAFSPNNDGVNDIFTLYADADMVKRIRSMYVYSRWGNQVYGRQNIDYSGPDTGWDGTFNDEMMNPGVFIYYIEVEYFDGFIEVYKGDVTLIR